MTYLARRFLQSSEAATSIEYALIFSSVALVILLGVASVGSNLKLIYSHIAEAFR
jgi:Flp pilus assembly pilin Flp